MTRKRFVKLLMGRFGHDRDFANKIASAIRHHGRQYDEKFFWQWLIYVKCRRSDFERGG